MPLALSQVLPNLNQIFLQQIRSAILAMLGGVLPGFASATIASATTIAPQSRFTVISGAATIQTIDTVGFTPGAVVSLLAAPGATWSVGTAGNVALAVGSVTAGKVYDFVFDGLKWYPN